MEKIIPQNILNFLEEYQKLCQKYKIGLRGCGCCGSPYLDIENDKIDNINYDKKSNCITILDKDWEATKLSTEYNFPVEITLNEYLAKIKEKK